MVITECPRCGLHSFEQLASHSYCIECNYFPEDTCETKKWREREFRTPRYIRLIHPKQCPGYIKDARGIL